MTDTKRNTLKAMALVGGTMLTAPRTWTSPLVNSIILPAHAQTSFGGDCSDIQEEPVDEPIALTVTASEVLGPIIIPRSGSMFSAMQTSQVGQCAGATENLSQTIELSGTISVVDNTITGDFILRQFCGSQLACEQITSYVATQVTPDPGSDLGEYQGRVIGTLRCCTDFL